MHKLLCFVGHYYTGAINQPRVFFNRNSLTVNAVSGGVNLQVAKIANVYRASIDHGPVFFTQSRTTILRQWLKAC